jgi:hypothetical protein
VQVPGVSYPTPQTVTGNLVDPASGDSQKGKRLDLEYRLGDHSLRGGIDRIDVESMVGFSLAGGYRWTYRKAADPTAPSTAPSKRRRRAAVTARKATT